MMKEVGFDLFELGFPSIMGCHAVVFQTQIGLYGFHIAGSSGENDWLVNAICFRQFILNHGGLAFPGSRLYGVTFVGNNQRGYKAPARENWKQELITFSNTLNYNGKISGYDLFKSIRGNFSAYVEFRKNGSKCDLYIRKWLKTSDPGGPDAAVSVPNPDPANHKMILKHGYEASLGNVARIVNVVNRNNLVHVHKEQLR